MNIKRNRVVISIKTKFSYLERLDKDDWLNTKVLVTLKGGNATIKEVENSYKKVSIKFALDCFISLLIYCPS